MNFNDIRGIDRACYMCVISENACKISMRERVIVFFFS
jgi:hypothetical protein